MPTRGLAKELNADVGEGYPYDDQLLEIITAANVACGFHAGDESTMRRLCERAATRDVAVGAQFSYRDRAGFGRRDVEISTPELIADLSEQVALLWGIARSAGTDVSYVKPHGALYNRAVHDDGHAAAVVAVAAEARLPVLCLPGSRLAALAEDAGLAVRREFFADRAYDDDGRLVPRSEPGAVISDVAKVTERVGRLLADEVVVSAGGRQVPVTADSICVHGDTRDAVDLARAVRAVLERCT